MFIYLFIDMHYIIRLYENLKTIHVTKTGSAYLSESYAKLLTFK